MFYIILMHLAYVIYIHWMDHGLYWPILGPFLEILFLHYYPETLRFRSIGKLYHTQKYLPSNFRASEICFSKTNFGRDF